MHVIILSWCSFTYHYVCSWAYSSQPEDKEPSHTAPSQVYMFRHFGIHHCPIYRTVHKMPLLFHRPLYRLSLADMKHQYKGYQHLDNEWREGWLIGVLVISLINMRFHMLQNILRATLQPWLVEQIAFTHHMLKCILIVCQIGCHFPHILRRWIAHTGPW